MFEIYIWRTYLREDYLRMLHETNPEMEYGKMCYGASAPLPINSPLISLYPRSIDPYNFASPRFSNLSFNIGNHSDSCSGWTL